MNDLMTHALMIASSLDYDLINQILWLIAIILKLVIGLAAFAVITSFIFVLISMLD